MGNSDAARRFYRSVPVHPHAGGELIVPTVAPFFQYGSSPRRWGTLSQRHFKECDFRFIPTQVGNSRIGRSNTTRSTVHPHAGGELTSRCGREMFPGGSSPRRWGTLAEYVHSSHVTRFIPTQVGNSLDILYLLPLRSVHPHAGGELHQHIYQKWCFHGSSPRRWGTLFTIYIIKPEISYRSPPQINNIV